jgi:hypothetical protein
MTYMSANHKTGASNGHCGVMIPTILSAQHSEIVFRMLIAIFCLDRVAPGSFLCKRDVPIVAPARTARSARLLAVVACHAPSLEGCLWAPSLRPETAILFVQAFSPAPPTARARISAALRLSKAFAQKSASNAAAQPRTKHLIRARLRRVVL